MNLRRIGVVLVPLMIVGAIAFVQLTTSAQSEEPIPSMQPDNGWQGMMGGGMMGRWGGGNGWQGPGPMPRHHMAMMWGIPAPYASMTNPLPRTQTTLKAGATVYKENCAACHGEDGSGNGEAGRNLSPPPGNLAWLSNMPIGQWDALSPTFARFSAFIYWTVAEGGTEFGTAMPPFKDGLSKDEIWAVAAYIEAHLPQDAK